MSSHGFPTLRLDVRGRRTEMRCAAILGLLSSAAPMLVAGNIGWWWAAGIALMTSAAVLTAFRQAGWMAGDDTLLAVTWRSDGGWLLCDARGRNFEAVLGPDSRMSPKAVWLRWDVLPATLTGRGTRRTRILLLCPGDVPAGDFRRLLVRLRVDRSECAPTAVQVPLTVS